MVSPHESLRESRHMEEWIDFDARRLAKHVFPGGPKYNASIATAEIDKVEGFSGANTRLKGGLLSEELEHDVHVLGKGGQIGSSSSA